MRLLQSKHITGMQEGKKYFLYTEREKEKINQIVY